LRNINRVVLTGGVAAEPELRRTPSGAPVMTLRIAFATQRKVDGEWQQKSNYVDVELWGVQAENAAKHLARGRQVAIDGRLEWIDYDTRDGVKRQLHKIVADSVQYLPPLRQRERSFGPGEVGAAAGASEASEGIPF
jgi:single-strand DNA-binding protein